MLDSLSLALGQLRDARIQRLILVSIAVAISALVILTILSQWLLERATNTGFGWLDWIVQMAGLGGAVILAWFLFPVLMTAMIGLFLDSVIDAVEVRHYPSAAPNRDQPVGEAIKSAVRFALLALCLNVLVLPFYIIPGANLPIFLALNSYLLGREYFEQIAARRMTSSDARALRRKNGRRCWLAGIVLAGMLLVPFFNLIAPIVGIAFMVHRMYRWRVIMTSGPTQSLRNNSLV